MKKQPGVAYKPSEMFYFTFKPELSGYGKNAQEAWQDAVENFTNDPGSEPNGVVIRHETEI